MSELPSERFVRETLNAPDQASMVASMAKFILLILQDREARDERLQEFADRLEAIK